MAKFKTMKYAADSGRGTGSEKVICVRLETPNDILSVPGNPVLSALSASGLSGAVGLYFYRFIKQGEPFIKIGECTRSDGVSVRFKRGWHGTEKYTDNYRRKKKNGVYVDSEFYSEIMKISQENPAYFVFYEHRTILSHPKIDELYAYRKHLKLFKKGTLSPEKMNGNSLLARRLVWHRQAFSEVVRLRFPDKSSYP